MEPEVLLENRHQARKVRALTWAFLLVACGTSWAALGLAESYGLSPGDGGVLRPPGERYAMASTVAALGLLPALGMLGYGRRYLTSIVRTGDRIELETLGLFGSGRRLEAVPGDLSGGERHAGKVRGPRSVDAPWLTLGLAGHRIPFVVDLQAERVEVEALVKLARAKKRK